MEWTKIKPQHFLYTDLSLGNIGCLTVLLCLTAHLERLPTDKERVKHTHIRALESLDKVLMNQGRSVDEVLMKVLEDSDKIEHKRELNRNRQKTFRDKEKGSNALCNEPDKIRVDKIRVEHFALLWEKYPTSHKQGKEVAFKKYQTTVKTEKDRKDIEKALTNYKKSDRVSKNFVLKGSKWFSEWQDWVDHTDQHKSKEHKL